MPTYIVFLAYGAAVALAFLLLWWFHSTRWYWHTLAVVAALAIGVTPMPFEISDLSRRYLDMAVGSVFLLLFFWGAGAPLFRERHPH
jgi:hypothetical protein